MPLKMMIRMMMTIFFNKILRKCCKSMLINNRKTKNKIFMKVQELITRICMIHHMTLQKIGKCSSNI